MQAIRRGSFEGSAGDSQDESTPSPEFITQEDIKSKAIASDPYPWILHPVIDALFCCGGALWLLLAAVLIGFRADMQSGWTGISLLVVNVLGQVFFADAHQPATLWRVYVSKRTRDSVGAFVTVCGIIAFALGIAGLFSAGFTAGLVKVTLAWSIQHLLAQAYGVSLIYCFKRKYFMSKTERDIFYWMFQTCLAFVVLRMFTFQSFAQRDLYGLSLPFWGPLPDWLCYAALVVFQINVLLFAGMVVRKAIKEKKVFPLPALAATMTAIVIPLFNYLQPVAFVIFIQTFYHASQYIVVTIAYYLKERGLPAEVPPAKIASMLNKSVVLKYLGITAGVGLLMFVALPLSLAAVGISKSVAMCVVYCVFNLHHYVTDAAIWRMKDPEVRKLLVA